MCSKISVILTALLFYLIILNYEDRNYLVVTTPWRSVSMQTPTPHEGLLLGYLPTILASFQPKWIASEVHHTGCTKNWSGKGDKIKQL